MPKKPSLSAYELARLQRIRENQQELAKIGMGHAKITNFADKPKSPKRRRTLGGGTGRKRKAAASPAPLRRSSRQAGEVARYSGLTDEDMAKLVARSMRPTRQRSEIRVRDPPTAEQLARLASAKDWLDDFAEFLVKVPHGSNGNVISNSNQGRVMRQVQLLVSGEGVDYLHWPKDVVFRQNQPVTLEEDMLNLWEEAKKYEIQYGEDKGHGWLLAHPITKLACYQVYCIQRDEEASASSSSSSSSSSASSSSSSSSSSAVVATAAASAATKPPTPQTMGKKKKSKQPNPAKTTAAVAKAASETTRTSAARTSAAASPDNASLFKVGDHVEVKWAGKAWYPATVEKIMPNGDLDCKFAGEELGYAKASWVRGGWVKHVE